MEISFRSKIYLDNNESSKTVEELQNRIRSNIDSIQMLNHQVIDFFLAITLSSDILSTDNLKKYQQG